MRDPGEVQAAATVLQSLLPRQAASPSRALPTSRVRAPPSLVKAGHNGAGAGPTQPEPYRTLPLVLPGARTVHDQAAVAESVAGQQGGPDQPFRSAAHSLPGPRTIHECRAGGPSYQPYRGPQYYAGSKPATVVAGIYNSPAPLYRMEDTEVTPVQVDTPASPARSVASPARSVSSPEPALPARHRPQVPSQPSIIQSDSFKKVMYSVMRDSEF